MKRKLIAGLTLYFSILLQAFSQSPQIPSARSGYALVYDPNRNVVVLFGGQDAADARLNDTWEWAGGVWKKINVTGPSARMNASMAYDADKKLVFLFGGRTESGTENDFWAYNGKSWSKMNTPSAPPQRQMGAMVFDKNQSQFVLFGGMDANKNPLGDTWILKDNEWMALDISGPSPRASHCMVYNENTGTAFMYGGYINGSASKEFWEFKDGTWHNLTAKSGPVRIHTSIAYDPDNGRMLMFGGFGAGDRTNELWEYANNKWSMIPAQKDNVPDPRAEHRSLFIPGMGLFVFGGVTGPDVNTRNRGNDTWLYKEGAWVRLN